ncbi:MAG TPA: MBL fold metallo-hydrolase [Ktedonobacteraceae bacterium]|nr:MBL fold metallo-hydrolase [Ktedonobacteraceae bacterium]
MRVISLGSGSSGNALLVEAGPHGRTKLLIDAGFPGRVLTHRLRHAGVSPARLTGILITHEHIDHVLGLPYMIKNHALPIITDPLTIEAMERLFTRSTAHSASGALIPLELESSVINNAQVEELFHPLPSGSFTSLGDIEVTSFPVSHDAAAPCGYLLSAGGCRVCVVIDSGEVTASMLENMQKADLLVLESNHDRERLLRGPYPYALKQRILSATGHLSNDQSAEAVLRTWRGDAVRWLWLSHLSRTNNTPQLALNTMRARISEAGANLAQAHITVLPPHMGGVWDSTQLWQNASLWEMQE